MAHIYTNFTKKCALVLALAHLSNFQSAIASDEAIMATYQDENGPWQYLEYQFIIKPNNELNRFIDKVISLSGLVGAAALIKQAFFDTISQDSKKKSFAENITLVVSTATVGKMLYDHTWNKAKASIQHTTLLNLLAQWNLHRQNFPTCLLAYFDELAALYTNCPETITKDKAAEVFELVTHHIEHHLESRYKKSDPKCATALETFKGYTDIFKNLQ